MQWTVAKDSSLLCALKAKDLHIGPSPCSRQNLTYDDLKLSTVLCCVRQLYTKICTHE